MNRNQKGSFLPIIGLLLFLIIISCGVYFVHFKDNRFPIFFKNTQSTQQTPTPSPTQSPISSFTSNELKISFRYPSEIGTAKESAAAGKIGPTIEGEEWWRIDFGMLGYGLGYYLISASTSNFTPAYWEGEPQWLNAKITEEDTESSVTKKLTDERFTIVKVQKVKNPNNLTAFKVWKLDCFGPCALSRDYVLPFFGNKYNNLLIYTKLKIVTHGNENETLELAKTLAIQEIEKIGNNQIDDITKKYLDGQDLIFNSLTFDK